MATRGISWTYLEPQICVNSQPTVTQDAITAASRLPVRRTQFGRPLSRFEAVKHLVSDVAAQTSLARAATDAAVAPAQTTQWLDGPMLFAVAAAKSCVGHASSVVVRGSHQALGAIGTTLEHEPHTLTKPVLARRHAYGSLCEWDETLTSLAFSGGRDHLWSLITTGRGSDTQTMGPA